MLSRYLFASILSWACAAAPAAAQSASPKQLTGKTMNQTTVDLAQLRGKVVLVFFWSTDCPVCLDKLPELRRNLEAWRGKDFVIVAVSQDRSMADLKAYEQVLDRVAPANAQMRIVWRRDAGHRDSFGNLPVKTPTSFILDRKGALTKQVDGRIPVELWDDIAELVLN